MLKMSFDRIRRAIDYQAEDQLSISIFQKMLIDGEEQMVRIAGESTNPNWVRPNPRSWRKGRGYTGVCWRQAEEKTGKDVIIEDASDANVAANYPVDDPDPDRDMLYQSAVAVPIMIEADDIVWGVVTATSSRRAAFRRDPENLQVQNVDMIRDVARCASLLAALR